MEVALGVDAVVDPLGLAGVGEQLRVDLPWRVRQGTQLPKRGRGGGPCEEGGGDAM